MIEKMYFLNFELATLKCDCQYSFWFQLYILIVIVWAWIILTKIKIWTKNVGFIMKIVNGCFFIFTMLKRNINYRNMLPCAGATFELARSKECMHEWGQWSGFSINQFSTRTKLYWKCVLFYNFISWLWGGGGRGGLNATL